LPKMESAAGISGACAVPLLRVGDRISGSAGMLKLCIFFANVLYFRNFVP
jgi:hypothetical protein